MSKAWFAGSNICNHKPPRFLVWNPGEIPALRRRVVRRIGCALHGQASYLFQRWMVGNLGAFIADLCRFEFDLNIHDLESEGFKRIIATATKVLFLCWSWLKGKLYRQSWVCAIQILGFPNAKVKVSQFWSQHGPWFLLCLLIVVTFHKLCGWHVLHWKCLWSFRHYPIHPIRLLDITAADWLLGFAWHWLQIVFHELRKSTTSHNN